MIEIIIVGGFLLIACGIQVVVYASLSNPKSAKNNSSSSLISTRIQALKQRRSGNE